MKRSQAMKRSQGNPKGSFLRKNKLLNKHGKAYRETDLNKKSLKRNVPVVEDVAESDNKSTGATDDIKKDNPYSELIGSLRKKPKNYFEEIMVEHKQKDNDDILDNNHQTLDGIYEDDCDSGSDCESNDDQDDDLSFSDADSNEEDEKNNAHNFEAKFGSEVELQQTPNTTLVDVPNTLYKIKKSSECPKLDDISEVSDLEATGLEPSLVKQWISTTKQIKSKGVMRPLSSLLYPYMAAGSDVLFSQSSFENLPQIQKLLALHVVDHAFKTRKCVLKNNKKSADSSSDNLQDQGYTRPTILILAPFKNIAYNLVQEIIKVSLTGTKRQVSNRKRFDEEYGPDSDEKPNLSKSISYQKTFLGNNDDFFTLGLAFAKNSVKLFTSFYNSDIIIASPLGLRNLVGAEGDKERDYDFLSSIEILGILGCDMLLMQNWEHLLQTLKHMNLQPVKDHSTDFSRVKKWVLDGLGKSFRQNLIFGAWSCPEIASLFGTEFINHRGSVMVSPLTHSGALSDILVPARQIFLKMRERREEESMVEFLTTGRFNYFVENVMPRFSSAHSVILVIPSYFDFIRLRNHVKKEGLQYSVLSEYSSNKTITNTRRLFAEGNVKLLLTTERFFFFKRYSLKNAAHVVFYQAPLYPECYTHYVNMLTAGDASSHLLYSKYDNDRMERVVGEKQLRSMLESQQRTHMIISQ